jgi:hypothetical protein
MRFDKRELFSDESQGPILIYPDRGGIEFWLNNKDLALNTEPIKVGTPILPWLDHRYRTGKRSYDMVSIAKGGFKMAFLHKRSHELTLQVFGPPPEDEPIEIKLNEYGALEGSKPPEDTQLKTLVEVKGEKGNVYSVDLTDLVYQRTSLIHPSAVVNASPLNEGEFKYYADLYSAHSVKTRDDRKNLILEDLDDYAELERHVSIAVRKKCSKEEFRINFPEPEESVANDVACHLERPLFIHGLENIRELQHVFDPKGNAGKYDFDAGNHWMPSAR